MPVATSSATSASSDGLLLLQLVEPAELAVDRDLAPRRLRVGQPVEGRRVLVARGRGGLDQRARHSRRGAGRRPLELDRPAALVEGEHELALGERALAELDVGERVAGEDERLDLVDLERELRLRRARPPGRRP